MKALRGGRDDHTKQKAISELLPLIFHAIDINKDGLIESSEFQTFFESLGVNDTKLAINVFRDLDTNHDCFLSQEGLLLTKISHSFLLFVFILF